MRNNSWRLTASLAALAAAAVLGTSAVRADDQAAGSVRIGVLDSTYSGSNRTPSKASYNPDAAAGKVHIGVLDSNYVRTSAQQTAPMAPGAACDAAGCDGCAGQGCPECCDEPAGRCHLGGCLSKAFDHYDDCWYQYGDGWYECEGGCCYGGHCGGTYDCCGNGDCNECEDCEDDDFMSCLTGTKNGVRHISHFRYRNELASQRLCHHLAERLAYFHCSGSGGAGTPLVGHYHRTYAVNPSHFDARDGRVYAAQGTGVPMAVPLAPNVNYTYNYGWGVPSSRLTQISRPQPFSPIVTP